MCSATPILAKGYCPNGRIIKRGATVDVDGTRPKQFSSVQTQTEVAACACRFYAGACYVCVRTVLCVLARQMKIVKQ